MEHLAVAIAKADKRRMVLDNVHKLPYPFAKRLEIQAFLSERGRALSLTR